MVHQGPQQMVSLMTTTSTTATATMAATTKVPKSEVLLRHPPTSTCKTGALQSKKEKEVISMELVSKLAFNLRAGEQVDNFFREQLA